MARPKEFEREKVLEQAVQVFANHGYGGTSTDVLLRAMGISRQSMYDTFGDKHNLYVQALQQYVVGSISEQIRVLNTHASPMKGLSAMLEYFIAQALADPEPKCMGLAAICEFGRSDAEITTVTDMAQKTLQSALERRLSEAKASDEMGKDIDVKAAAYFILSNVFCRRSRSEALLVFSRVLSIHFFSNAFFVGRSL